ncbi:MAG: AAA family ATPase [bacterium]|nr:AAA family ATPase [bacterium]
MGYQGRASSIIVKLFEHIAQEYNRIREPIILFFDEAESIVGSRGETDSSSGAQENIAIVDSIIVGVDSLRRGMQARVVALFATNLTERIDPALLRRSYYHHFNRPSDIIRFQLFENALSGLNFNHNELESLVKATSPRMVNGSKVEFTPSDIIELIIGRAINEAINKRIIQ